MKRQIRSNLLRWCWVHISQKCFNKTLLRSLGLWRIVENYIHFVRIELVSILAFSTMDYCMTLLSDTVFIQNKHKYVTKYSWFNVLPELNNHCISIHYYSIPFVFIGRNFQFYFDLIFSQSILSLFYLSRYVSFFGNHIWCALLVPAWNVILKLFEEGYRSIIILSVCCCCSSWIILS